MKNNTIDGLTARAAFFSSGTPATINREARTVDFTLSTGNSVRVFDRDSWKVINESLAPVGVKLPAGRNQVPLLDTHDSSSVQNIFGSVRNLRIEENGVSGTLHFSTDDASQRAFALIEQGHLTDGSVGYIVKKAVMLKEGERTNVNGKDYEGPQRVVTEWELKEFSLAPIGADAGATVRTETTNKELEKMEDVNITEQPAERTESPVESAPVVAETPTAAPVDTEEIKRSAAESARNVVLTIRNECDTLGITGKRQEKILAIESLAEARAAMIEELKRMSNPVSQSNVTITVDESTKFRAAATDGILLRAGVRVANPTAGAESLRLGFKALARECVERNGTSTRGMTDEKIFELALRGTLPYQGTSDFSNILLDASNKATLAGWEAIPSTFEQWCKIGSVSDFKTHNRARLSDAPTMDKVGEQGELPRKSFKDAGAKVAAESYGMVFGISRQALINDDLSLFNDIPMMIGARARQQINAFAYQLLATNKLSDGSTDAFSSGNKNLATTGAAPSAVTLSAARVAMMQQTDIQGTKLNMQPAFIICGPQNADNVFIMMNSQYLPGEENARSPFFNMAQPIVDANIATKAWYLAASPVFPTVEIVFLNGQRVPVIEELPPTEILGMTMRAYLDWGGSILDYRGLYKNAGE